MKFLLLAICIILFYNDYFFIKARLVDFEKEMISAKFIDEVIIEHYDSTGHFTFHSLVYKDTIRSASSHKWYNRFMYEAIDSTHEWTSCSPSIKDTVLIVLDSTYNISLFAKLIGNDYRFWDAHPSTSIAFFVFKPPVKRLDDKRQHIKVNSEESTTSCWDGCLLNRDSISLYKKK
jgi:hypothetical protein